jgi:hypothetical protein
MRIITPSSVYDLNLKRQSKNVVSLYSSSKHWRASDADVNLKKRVGLERHRRYEGALESEVAAARQAVTDASNAYRNAQKVFAEIIQQAFEASPILTYEEVAAEIAKVEDAS